MSEKLGLAVNPSTNSGLMIKSVHSECEAVVAVKEKQENEYCFYTVSNELLNEEVMEMSATQANEEQQQSNALPMIIVAGLFFILGFATWLNGSLMPYLQQILQLSPFEASLILFSF